MPSSYHKEDDYTLRATSTTPGGGSLSRYFNFAAEQVTTIYERKEQLKDQYSSYGTGAATSVSVALASEFNVQKFSELDSLAEVEMMHAKLTELGGKPPSLGDLPGKARRSAGLSKL